jgi:hypothetical protein
MHAHELGMRIVGDLVHNTDIALNRGHAFPPTEGWLGAKGREGRRMGSWIRVGTKIVGMLHVLRIGSQFHKHRFLVRAAWPCLQAVSLLPRQPGCATATSTYVAAISTPWYAAMLKVHPINKDTQK